MDVQVDEDLTFQRRAWIAQRVAWVGVVGTLIAAMLGAFGDGPLARASAGSGDGSLEVTYQRLDRHRSPSALTFVVDVEPGEDSVALWLDRTLAAAHEIETVHPEPDSTSVTNERLVYEFAVEDGTSAVTIVFDTMPGGIGTKRGRAGIVDGPAVSITQFVFP